MRIIKLAIISFVFLFLVITLISLLIPSHIRISKAANFGLKKEAIISLVKNKESWKQWHPAFMVDNVRWKQKISFLLLSDTDSIVVWKMEQPHKNAVINGWHIYEYPGADSLTVQWYMDFDLPWYPWQKFGSLFYENTYGIMMQQGLQNLKTIVDK
ncbi:MAG: hypothetical protein V4676_06390 [Bacteroidota bacterium]